jgi:hypothetical protein
MRDDTAASSQKKKKQRKTKLLGGGFVLTIQSGDEHRVDSLARPYD